MMALPLFPLGLWAASLRNDLVAYWSLNESSGTRNDSHGSAHLASNNAVGSVAGVLGNAAGFASGSSQYLSVASRPALQAGSSSWSITAWVKLADIIGDHTIAGKAASGNDEFGLEYRLATTRFELFIRDTGAVYNRCQAAAAGLPVVGAWYFIVAGYDRPLGRSFIQVNNGAENTLSFAGTPFAGSAAFVLGSYRGTANYMNGAIDECGYWKRVLTADERAALYNAGAGRTYPW